MSSHAESLVALIPDFPKPGVLFRDVTPVFADPDALVEIADGLVAPFEAFDYVAGIEARGFPIAGAIGVRARVGVVLIRKAGKLPRPATSADYELEYGTATIELQSDIPAGSRVLLVDDVLATGGTARAACQLIESIGCSVIGFAALQEVPELDGRATLGELPIHILFSEAPHRE